MTLMDVLDDMNEARKELLLAGKDWTAKAKNAETAREAAECMAEGVHVDNVVKAMFPPTL